MRSPLRGLGLPLYRRSWSNLKIVIGSIIVAWLWHRPTDVAAIAVSCLLGGLAVWFFMASPLVWKYLTHRIPVVRGITLAVVVICLVAFMRTVIPYVHGIVR